MVPRIKKSKIWGPQKHIETVNPIITTLFCIIINILRSHQVAFLAPGGVRTHLVQPPPPPPPPTLPKGLT